MECRQPMPPLELRILGIRGVPARHGGFETFAARLAPFLADRSWQVTVYCQERGRGRPREGHWQGVHTVHIPVPGDGPFATVLFDALAILHAVRRPGLVLTLGYNTACFGVLHRWRRLRHLINMDGLEWQRGKWRRHEKLWLHLNERLACLLGDHLIADHPEIERHLRGRRGRPGPITMIPYGSDLISHAPVEPVASLGLIPGDYALCIARPEPENSILEMVRAFSARPRGIRLVVLGRYLPDRNAYHRRVLRAASSEVLFPGALYDEARVSALRFHAALYLHGHTVGGTNPSLVEALGAGTPVLARDNPFNRWVAGPGAVYFGDEADCARQLDALIGDRETLARMRQASRDRHAADFTWDRVLADYERLLLAQVHHDAGP